VKELRESKARKEKKQREKEEKKLQRKRAERDVYKWLDEWSPVVPTAAVGADDAYVNNANNINNAAAAAAAAEPGLRPRPQRSSVPMMHDAGYHLQLHLSGFTLNARFLNPWETHEIL